MKIKVLFFAKIRSTNGGAQVYFATQGSEIPSLSIAKNSLEDFLKIYPLKRHASFDSNISKTFSIRYLLEWKASLKASLPNEIKAFDEVFSLNWSLFPQAVKMLSDGKEKNYLQLAVQYISNGGIDESVIAADFDEAFIKSLQKKLDE
ncbi:hypothetical protein [Silvanigrella aquatica]|uniref:Uncharacterized protein n=1 Tax=Silvanigrella aquatica TaxID=1915309 RepID=A0A1L4D2Y5_9BACT|nr:hypothetical protein [Silvanigrella aquatica]APJ04551.1 hypothetical protein AXG55_11800 [Silvanigrella aquatica]